MYVFLCVCVCVEYVFVCVWSGGTRVGVSEEGGSGCEAEWSMGG